MFKLHLAQKAGFYSKSVWFLLLMIQTEDKFDSRLCRRNGEGEAMKKNYSSICCCKNFEWAESQPRPELPVVRVNVAPMQECGELLWRRETICMITRNTGVLHRWMTLVRFTINVFSWNQRNPSLNAVNPTLWQCLHHRILLIHMQGLAAAQPHPCHWTSVCPAAQHPSKNELQGTARCALVARVCTQPPYC